jgi:hypothetical protein
MTTVKASSTIIKLPMPKGPVVTWWCGQLILSLVLMAFASVATVGKPVEPVRLSGGDRCKQGGHDPIEASRL